VTEYRDLVYVQEDTGAVGLKCCKKQDAGQLVLKHAVIRSLFNKNAGHASARHAAT